MRALAGLHFHSTSALRLFWVGKFVHEVLEEFYTVPVYHPNGRDEHTFAVHKPFIIFPSDAVLEPKSLANIQVHMETTLGVVAPGDVSAQSGGCCLGAPIWLPDKIVRGVQTRDIADQVKRETKETNSCDRTIPCTIGHLVADKAMCLRLRLRPPTSGKKGLRSRLAVAGKLTEHESNLKLEMALLWRSVGVLIHSRLGPRKGEKNGPPSRVAVVELGNIETVHEPKPIQAVGALCMDRVAVLWSDPTAHTLREVKERMPSSRIQAFARNRAVRNGGPLGLAVKSEATTVSAGGRRTEANYQDLRKL
ncbi:hypothetical protein B0H11DRAFT_1926449 [Mycena galericulata]|nr:hypothetical protein B0H11DRAFT_1926449 [Mycena galericulata]